MGFDWYALPLRLYCRSAPSGLVIVIIACPKPAVQSVVYTGVAGNGGCAVITTFAEADDVQFDEFVTVNE